MFVTLVKGYKREPVPPARIMPFIFLPPVEYIFERMELKYLNDVVEVFESVGDFHFRHRFLFVVLTV